MKFRICLLPDLPKPKYILINEDNHKYVNIVSRIYGWNGLNTLMNLLKDEGISGFYESSGIYYESSIKTILEFDSEIPIEEQYPEYFI